MTVITRFAPSPTGYLHLGHAWAAAQAFGYGQDHNGICLLRIEDIDTARCKQHFTDAIYEDLAWLGFSWPKPVRVQSAHFTDYANIIAELKQKGLLYPCFKTRKEIFKDSLKSGGVYRGPKNILSEDETALRISQGQMPAWRLSMRRARDLLGDKFDHLSYIETGVHHLYDPGIRRADPWRFGDEVIARKDIGVSYHLAVTHDDHLQNITHVVRGTDLADTTGFHVLLQTLMGWSVPTYHHHRLILKTDGEKLSKRRGDTAIRALREAQHSPSRILDMVSADISS